MRTRLSQQIDSRFMAGDHGVTIGKIWSDRERAHEYWCDDVGAFLEDLETNTLRSEEAQVIMRNHVEDPSGPLKNKPIDAGT